MSLQPKVSVSHYSADSHSMWLWCFGRVSICIVLIQAREQRLCQRVQTILDCIFCTEYVPRCDASRSGGQSLVARVAQGSVPCRAMQVRGIVIFFCGSTISPCIVLYCTKQTATGMQEFHGTTYAITPPGPQYVRPRSSLGECTTSPVPLLLRGLLILKNSRLQFVDDKIQAALVWIISPKRSCWRWRTISRRRWTLGSREAS